CKDFPHSVRCDANLVASNPISDKPFCLTGSGLLEGKIESKLRRGARRSKYAHSAERPFQHIFFPAISTRGAVLHRVRTFSELLSRYLIETRIPSRPMPK